MTTEKTLKIRVGEDNEEKSVEVLTNTELLDNMYCVMNTLLNTKSINSYLSALEVYHSLGDEFWKRTRLKIYKGELSHDT